MISKRLHFTGSLGFKLSALLDLPDRGDPLVYAIFAHCFTCNKNYKILNHVNQALTDHNIGVLRFDFTGLGASQGSFADTNFSSNVGDILAAAEFLDLNYHSPQLLIGHSFGGAAVIHTAPKIYSCAAVVTIATPADVSSIRAILLSKRIELERNGFATFSISGREFLIGRQFLDDLEQIDFAQSVRNLNKPILICHSPQDELVDIQEAYRLLNLANHPKSLLSLDRADHLVSNEKDGKYLGSVIAAWAQKYIHLPSSSN
ncbi:MAG: lysophospholipase [candidate division KSB1 bacterium]|nr:lysophospholipase [candidate division KSB1 bacterium]MDZ7333633.1 lysophospholipase [candidate division KSB1 bacterium]MDZ7398747.1 lysophospholipase [candidate division KSB1 bacterium]